MTAGRHESDGSVRVVQFMRHPRPNMFSIERLYGDIREAMPPDCYVSVWTCHNPSKGLWPRVQDMISARKNQGDVNHVTGDVHYLTCLLDPRRAVLTIHDLVSLHRLRGAKRLLLWFFWYWLPVRRSRVVVVISESTRQMLLASVPCDPAKIRVIHNSVSDEFVAIPHVFNSKYPRILHIGTKSNKNLERTAEALVGMPCRLVIVGPLSPSQITTLEKFAIDYENHVGLSRAALLKQYAECDMLVFVSIYEGFGLPIIEANAVGRPVVTSNLLSMPEIADKAACLVDPFNVSDIREGVRKVLHDRAYRDRLVEAGYVNAKRFRADLIATRYAALYREIATEGRNGNL